MRKEFRELASLEEALEVLEDLKLERKVEKVKLTEAKERVVAEPIESPIDVPGFDRSIMDGYAVKAEDTYGAQENEPVELKHGGIVHAGEEPKIRVTEGEAIEISTGAVIPEGADAVVKVEDTTEDDESIFVRKPVAPGDNIMTAGYDVAAGERVVRKGTRLTPREIGLLAALGFERVPVYTKPKVGIVSTGDEL
ncbi:MAG: molybdopterin biosynthesis protein, partial [Halobacteria archaeon]|nr:molybdopterin biosynthesis protein [Halobacteria archaeon]